MIEHGLRGGMTQCSFKKVEANNKYMNEDYDKSKPSSYISYLDANNLYGLAMCKKLPYGDFKWYYGRMDEKRVMKHSDDDDIGYILEVDLDYPKELHDLHKDYPLKSCVSMRICFHKSKRIYTNTIMEKMPVMKWQIN